jgi:hypothetical protein
MGKLTTKYAGDFPAADAGGRHQLGKGWINLPLMGGQVTKKARQLLLFGRASLVRNLRGEHPGYKSRGGSKKLHATAVASRVMSLFHYCKGRITERHFLAQFADGTIREADNAPPAVGAGAFGTTLFAGNSDPKPASWAVMDDVLIFATGADLPHFWAGDEDRVAGFFVHRGSGSIPAIPDAGADYTVEVTDDDDTTVAVLDSLETSASGHCLMIRTALPRLTGFRIVVKKPNANAATVSIQKYNGAWTDAGTLTDTTASGGATLAQNGSWTLAAPVTDAVAVYQQGVCGFWWRVFFSATLDSEVEISEVRYSADPSPLQIVWDSLMMPAVECQYYLAADDIYYRYDYTTCDLSLMATGDRLYMCFADPIEAFYLDMGESPSTTGTTIAKVGRWDGEQWVESDPVSDGSDGAGKSGWVVIGRPANPDQPRQFASNQWRGYWYYVRFTAALSDNVLATVYGQPYYDVADFGTKCLCCAAWKHRALYVFERYPQYIYVSSIRRPMSLRGNDSNILDPGDGRAHAVRAIVCFHNEIIVLQEERGTIGGCTTLYQGRDNATFGKRILSTRIGTWTPKSVAVVEGVYLTTATEERVATVVYWLSWHGLVRCDGRGVMDAVSDAVADRFDPLKPETCVRRGYEDRCGLFYDRSAHVLRVWLVCGTTATEPNWFGVYDLVDGAWYEDSYANHWTAMCEAEAASGDVAVIQVAGDSDGCVWQLNTGTEDDGVAIDHRMDVEFSAGSRWVTLHDVRARLDAAAGASLTIAAARDGRTEDAKYAITAPLDAKVSGEETVTLRRDFKVAAGHVTIHLSGASMALHDLAVRATVEEER